MEVHTVRDLGAAVRQARRRRGMSQAELAELAGVSREWLVRLEQGHPRLEAQLVLDALAAVGLTVLTTSTEQPAEDTVEATWDDLLSGLSRRTANHDPAQGEDTTTGEDREDG
ncbi:y4mF family transcriptional regulator [Kribbella amoyensis]|uniref:Y4mF family transcriptional regulator n=1 Tax=Kribbella amoyensis TaxID=996641 RepID=A0A561BRX8_9ACTN|nr:helix-turn-helix domain-containing protein [Kribbella amoyensis]TWD81616.1 y4mF family transcriptional regulator [Kribbella amoyensis]